MKLEYLKIYVESKINAPIVTLDKDSLFSLSEAEVQEFLVWCRTEGYVFEDGRHDWGKIWVARGWKTKQEKVCQLK